MTPYILSPTLCHQEKQSAMSFHASKIPYRLYFSLLFLVFGVLIALLTSITNYNLDIRSVQAELDSRAKDTLLQKRTELTSFTTLLEHYVAALRDSAALRNYILNPTPETRTIANQLFYSVNATNPALMQVRYLDTEGKEVIRIAWDTGSQEPEIAEQKDLQDKSDRYYFREASQIPANSFWYSRLDLNIEHKKIEIPHKPVLRIASPVYLNQKFRGIVLINIHAKGFLEKFKNSHFFNIVLVDHAGNYLSHYQEALSWSRYLATGHTLVDDYPHLATTILQDNTGKDLVTMKNLYAASLDNLLPKDQAHLLLIPKKQAVQGMMSKRRKAMFLIIGTILLLSIPLSILISKVPAKLNHRIMDQNRTLMEYIDLIDQNIITVTANRAGYMSKVSTAFCNISGFSKDDIIGQRPDMLAHPDKEFDVKQEVWQSIEAGKSWVGEFHNLRKDGTSYWLEATIFPKYDKEKVLIGSTAIYQDCTDKKHIEKLSITDDLTGLYNRRFFDESIEKELGRAMRDKKALAFTMLDVDYFKQYNDHYGHQKGDEALRTIGQTLQQCLNRSSDFCFRLGGEEFGIIFSDLSPEEAISFTENIRKAIEALAIEHQWGCTNKVITASFGLLSIVAAPGITVDTIYQRADQALYQAKQEGRNWLFFDLLEQPG